MTADRPATEPRTEAGRRLLDSIAPGRTDGWVAEQIAAVEAESYDAAMVDAFDDVQRIDRAEAAQGAAPRAEGLAADLVKWADRVGVRVVSDTGLGPVVSRARHIVRAALTGGPSDD